MSIRLRSNTYAETLCYNFLRRNLEKKYDQPYTLTTEYDQEYILAVAYKPVVCRHCNKLVPKF